MNIRIASVMLALFTLLIFVAGCASKEDQSSAPGYYTGPSKAHPKGKGEGMKTE